MAVQISGNDITVPRDGSFTRNVTIGGTLTYEDVTNIDSVGLVTARNGIEIGARPGVAASISVDGNMVVSGITTIGELISSYGTFVRNVNDNGLTIAGGNASNSGANVTVYGGSHGSYPDVVRFRIDGSEKARIDGSGRLLLGTTTQGESTADDLTIATSGSTGITIRAGTSNASNILFADGTSGDDAQRGIIQYHHSDDTMRLFTNATRRITIDSSGRLLIGTTSTSGISASADDLIIGSTNDSSTRGLTLASTTNANIRFSDDGDNATGMIEYNHSSNFMRIYVEGGEAMRIDSSRNLQIGTTAARDIGGLSVQRIHLEGTDGGSSSIGIVNNQNSTGRASLRFGKSRGTSANSNTVVQNGDALGEVVFSGSDGTDMYPTAASIVAEVNGTPGSNDMPGRLVFKTTTDGGQLPSETMRLGRSGSHAEVFVNCTETFTSAVFSLQTNGSCGIGLKTGATNSQKHLSFRSPNGEVGSITTSGSSTQYNTSSDYRLKENATAISDGITRLKTLKPYRFNFKADATTTVDGFFAHEVTAVPEAISGTKDEVDSDNNPVYQKIDHSKLVPLLTAALQESVTEIESLKARLDAAGL